MNGNNLNASKISRMVKSKGFVTALCGVLAVVVLLVGYNIRINNATKPVQLPVAKYTISPKTRITEEMIEYRSVPRGALNAEYYSNKNQIINKYSKVNAIIPAGSMFYTELLTEKDDLPDSALYDVPEGETLYYLTVNMLTSFTNSILPGRYIDIYISTKEDDKALVGKFIENVKVLQVKTSDGQNVFDDSESSRVPYLVMFSLPEEQHILMRDIEAINNYSISSGNSGFSSIDIFPVPTKAYYKDGDKEIQSTVSSQYLKNYIKTMAATIPQDIVVPTTTNE